MQFTGPTLEGSSCSHQTSGGLETGRGKIDITDFISTSIILSQYFPERNEMEEKRLKSPAPRECQLF